MQSNWQNLNYIAKYGNVRQQPKSTHWVVKYGNKVLTNPLSYAGCQMELKTFKMQGVLYPDKAKFKIVGV
jgi:hypothetical protein